MLHNQNLDLNLHNTTVKTAVRRHFASNVLELKRIYTGEFLFFSYSKLVDDVPTRQDAISDGNWESPN